MKKITVTASVLLFGLALSPFARAEVKASSSSNFGKVWVPVDEEVWKVLKEAPVYHFERAKSAWEKKDFKTAASELDKGTRFIKMQEKRLSTSTAELRRLDNDLRAGRVVTAAEIDAVFSHAEKALDQDIGLVPNGEDMKDFFSYGPNYHLEKAKASWEKKEIAAASAELNKAVAYMKWRAQFGEQELKATLDGSAMELSTLSRKLIAGVSSTDAEISHVLARAHAAIEGKS